MNNGRLKQCVVILAIIWSLALSSVAACACPHHHEKTEAQTPSCHQDSQMMTMTEDAPEAAQAQNSAIAIVESNCCCFQSAPRVFAKNDNLKIEKQSAAFLPVSNTEIKITATVVSFETIQFTPPFYLSDSFYNISPGRAPPR